MSELTANFQLPFLAQGQAQKHVTVNESLLRLDALVQISAVSASTATQPSSPADGARYVLPAGKTGAAWAAMANGAIAYYRDGAWEEITPHEGWLAWVCDANELRVYDGAAWSQSAIRSGLALGTAALKDTGVSGANVPLMDGANIWSGVNKFDARPRVKAGGTSYPTLGSAHGGAQISNANDDTYGLLLGVRGAGEAWLQAQRVDGAATAYDLVLQPSGGGVKIGANAAYHAGATPLPTADNTYNLGSASFRFATTYAATGTINTSDAREKTRLKALAPGEIRAIANVFANVGVFQWLSSVRDKGEDARLHIGVTAQSVRQCFEDEGLDPARYGLYCEDPLFAIEVEVRDVNSESAGERGASAVLDDAGKPVLRYGVRTDQLLLLGMAALFERARQN
ncbi:MAG: DUF2793 domain-containing protein [Terricaulis sp.]